MIAPRLRYDGRSPSPPTTELSGTDALKKIATLTLGTKDVSGAHNVTVTRNGGIPSSSADLAWFTLLATAYEDKILVHIHPQGRYVVEMWGESKAEPTEMFDVQVNG